MHEDGPADVEGAEDGQADILVEHEEAAKVAIQWGKKIFKYQKNGKEVAKVNQDEPKYYQN